jgi:hypothetical protein
MWEEEDSNSKTIHIKIALLSANKKTRSHTTTTTSTAATTTSSSSPYHTHPTQRTCTIGAEMDFATNLAPKRDPQKKTKPRNSAAAVGVIFIAFQLRAFWGGGTGGARAGTFFWGGGWGRGEGGLVGFRFPFFFNFVTSKLANFFPKD